MEGFEEDLAEASASVHPEVGADFAEVEVEEEEEDVDEGEEGDVATEGDFAGDSGHAEVDHSEAVGTIVVG